MNLPKNSFLVRWAYMLQLDHKIPQQTTLCDLFWNIVGNTILLLAAVVAVCCFSYLIVTEFAPWLWHNKLPTALVLGAIMLWGYLIWFFEEGAFNRTCARVSASVVGEAFRGVKNRYCPIVTITDPDKGQ